MSQSISSKRSIEKIERCPKCFRRLCHRIPIHEGNDEEYIIHIRHRGLELFCASVVLKCPVCRTTVRIEGNEGTVGVEKFNG